MNDTIIGDFRATNFEILEGADLRDRLQPGVTDIRMGESKFFCSIQARRKTTRTKVRKLVALGVGLDIAIKHAVSRKSYWRMCKTPAMRIAIPNNWLHEQGLLSLALAAVAQMGAAGWGVFQSGAVFFDGVGQSLFRILS